MVIQRPSFFPLPQKKIYIAIRSQLGKMGFSRTHIEIQQFVPDKLKQTISFLNVTSQTVKRLHKKKAALCTIM